MRRIRQFIWLHLAVCVALGANAQAQRRAGKPTLAVIDFAIKGPVQEKQAGEIVAGLFGTSLSRKYAVIERQQIHRVLDELKFQRSDLVDMTKVARLGRLLGADFIVIGTVSQLGHTVTVEARVVNVETGQWGERGFCYCTSLGEIPKNLPALLAKMKLLGEGGLARPLPKTVTGPFSYRQQAFASLIAKGNAALQTGNPDTALKFANEAMAIPGYEKNPDAAFLLRRAIAEHQRRIAQKTVFNSPTRITVGRAGATKRFSRSGRKGPAVHMTVEVRKGILYKCWPLNQLDRSAFDKYLRGQNPILVVFRFTFSGHKCEVHKRGARLKLHWHYHRRAMTHFQSGWDSAVQTMIRRLGPLRITMKYILQINQDANISIGDQAKYYVRGVVIRHLLIERVDMYPKLTIKPKK